MPITQLLCPHRARNFSYLLTCEQTRETAIVDPSFCDELLTAKLTDSNLELKYIINTHTHFDHTWGNQTLSKMFPSAQIAVHHDTDLGQQAGYLALVHEDKLQLGNQEIKILHTPGHTPGDICLWYQNSILTGDTLFIDKVGGTKDRDSAWTQFQSLNELMKLPENTEVLPGHDYGNKPRSTIAEQQHSNPFCIRLNDFEQFYWLKENWKSFKEQHGLS